MRPAASERLHAKKASVERWRSPRQAALAEASGAGGASGAGQESGAGGASGAASDERRAAFAV